MDKKIEIKFFNDLMDDFTRGKATIDNFDNEYTSIVNEYNRLLADCIMDNYGQKYDDTELMVSALWHNELHELSSRKEIVKLNKNDIVAFVKKFTTTDLQKDYINSNNKNITNILTALIKIAKRLDYVDLCDKDSKDKVIIKSCNKADNKSDNIKK